MPSTNGATLELIQREISEVAQREKELKEIYSRSTSVNNNNHITTNDVEIHNHYKAPLTRATSMSALMNGNNSTISQNGGRLFTQNTLNKGVMHRFIKSRGKIGNLSLTTTKNQSSHSSWTSVDVVEPEKPIVPVGMQPRNGFIPVDERIKREFQEMQKRESELLLERQKSQPDLLALLNSTSPEPERKSLQSARSISQLSDFDVYDESNSQPSSLKAARSLADLCDVDNEEMQPPGSLTLIKQWENLIQQNQTGPS